MKSTESLRTDKVPSQRELFAAVARGQIGYIEGPADNQTKYGRFTGANFLPWCGSFVMWCADKVKLRIPNCVSTQAGANAFMKSGRWQNAEVATPEVGDIAFFDFPGDNINRISHIGIVVKVLIFQNSGSFGFSLLMINFFQYFEESMESHCCIVSDVSMHIC